MAAHPAPPRRHRPTGRRTRPEHHSPTLTAHSPAQKRASRSLPKNTVSPVVGGLGGLGKLALDAGVTECRRGWVPPAGAVGWLAGWVAWFADCEGFCVEGHAWE